MTVIHEAREVSNQGDKNAWPNPSLVFRPLYMQTLRGPQGADGKAGLRVLVGRAGGGPLSIDDVSAHLLVVDSDRATTEVMKDAFFTRPGQGPLGAPAGSAYVLQLSVVGKLRLLRLDYPGSVHDLGELAMPRASGAVFTDIVGARLHIALSSGAPVVQPGGGRESGTSLWTVGLDGKDLRKEADGLPPVRMLAASSHYGQVVMLHLIPGIAFCEAEVNRAAQK